MTTVLLCRYEKGPERLSGDVPLWRWVVDRILWLVRTPFDDGPLRAVVNIGLLVVAMYCLRRARQAWLVYAPGPIDVLPLTDASGGGQAPIAELTTKFRTSLAEIGLWPPSPLPGGSPAVEFIQLLKQAPEEKKSVVATIGTVLGIADVRSAIVVSGIVRERVGGEPCGLTVQIATLPSGGSVPVDVWAATWDEVAERAACVVAATLLPRTRRCRRPPWATWQGLELDAELFRQYQRAQRYVALRRYDEGLGAYFEALERDPTNLYIRLELAQLFESLGLYLDALLAYRDLVRLGARRDRRLLDWLTRKDDPPSESAVARHPLVLPPGTPDDQIDWRSSRPPRRLSQRSQQVAILLGRYRHALLLGFGEQLSRQWCTIQTQPSWGERDRERERLRERLLEPFRFLYWDRHFFDLDEWGHRLADDLKRTLRDEKGPQAVAELSQRPHDERSKAYFYQIFVHWRRSEELHQQAWKLWQQEFFHWAAGHELRRLVRDYQWWRGRRFPGMPVSQTSLHIAHMWAPLRREWTRSLAGRDRIWSVPGVESFDETEPRKIRLPWPPRPQEVATALDRLLARRLPRWREWHDHYNAACTFAITLLPPKPANLPGRQEELANHRREEMSRGAMRHLRRAIDSMDSAYLSTNRDWIGGGDPDLVGLRATDDFRSFDGEYFPHPGPAPYRPSNAVALRITHYMSRLAILSARAKREEWNERGLSLAERPTSDVLRQWGDAEVDAWRLALQFARDYRHWQTRLRVLNQVQAWKARRGESFALSFPTYYDDPVIRSFDRSAEFHKQDPVEHHDPQKATRLAHERMWARVERCSHVAVRLRDARFEELASVITEELGIGTLSAEGNRSALECLATLPRGVALREYCGRWAAVWEALEFAFDYALRCEADPLSPVIDDEKHHWMTARTRLARAFEPHDEQTDEVREAARALFQPLRRRLQKVTNTGGEPVLRERLTR